MANVHLISTWNHSRQSSLRGENGDDRVILYRAATVSWVENSPRTT
jgi:hypothetical protein